MTIRGNFDPVVVSIWCLCRLLEALAEATGRATSNPSRMLRTMERYGSVKLHRGERERIRPEVPYKAIALELALT